MRTAILMLSLAGALLGCRDASHEGHDHEDGDHGHGHGHGEGAIPVTQWGEHAELFAEYTALVVGQGSETAIHVTKLADFTPVTVGTMTVELVQSNGEVVRVTADAPARPGIYTPTFTPTAAGECRLAMIATTDDWSERFDIEPCRVHATAPEPAEEGDDGEISFLKEQQWVTEFATVEATPRPLRKTVRVNAEVRPVSGKEAHLTAAVGGRVQFGRAAPVIGTPVRKGQLLATVTPPLQGATNRAALDAEVAAARAELEVAKADSERVKRLAAENAVAGKRVEEAASRVAVADSRLRAARERVREHTASTSGGGGSGNAFRVRSPIDGTLVAVDITNGETVGGGAHLFTVIDMDLVWVEGRVFEPDIPSVLDARQATFRVEGYDVPFTIDDTNGRLVTVGQVIDPNTRTVPIVFEVANPRGVLRIGQFAELEIAVGEAVSTLAVPRSAVLTDEGRAVVFVQTSGESFARRFVVPGVESAGWVAIESGIAAGERVVTRGAITVKLAGAASSAPAHGHAH